MHYGSPEQPAPAVEMQRITHAFGSNVAVHDVVFSAARGEVHAIVGENGAGKSTLMKILYAMHEPDHGEIRIDGRRVRFSNSADAIAAGIGMMHQHFMLVAPFSVLENVILGDEPSRMGTVCWRDAEAIVANLIRKFELGLDPRSRVEHLSVGQQQRVEILKVLFRSARIIILDEPTAVLTPGEVERLFETIEGLRAAGKTVIIITHKLREVMAVSSHLTILRAGRNVAVLQTADTTAEEVARLMVGRDVVMPILSQEIRAIRQHEHPRDQKPEPAEPLRSQDAVPQPLVSVAGICLRGGAANRPLNDVSFEIARGEILGIAGVEGNGQAELADVLTGMRMPSSGKFLLDGRDITRLAPREKFAAGIACIPEDRHRKGLILDFTLRENLLLGRHRDRAAKKLFSRHNAASILQEFDIRPPLPGLKTAQLSGGNQQKLIIAREVTRNAPFVIAAQPTRGVDLGAIQFIHQRLLDVRERGAAVLLISADLTEILALSHRVAVMYGGRIVFVAPNIGLTEDDLGLHMAGGSDAPAREHAQ